MTSSNIHVSESNQIVKFEVIYRHFNMFKQNFEEICQHFSNESDSKLSYLNAAISNLEQ